MIKLSRIIPMVLILGGISVLALSCAPKQSSTSTAQTQVVTIKRGNLSIDITAVGNLALSLTQDLAFEIPGTVEEVLVGVGDTVEKGQVLARLDTSQWDSQVTALQRQVTTAERQVTSAQKQLRDKQSAIVTAQNTVTSKEFALRQAQFTYQSANDTLNQITDVKKIQDQIDEANNQLDFIKSMIAGNFQSGVTVTDVLYLTNFKTQTEELIKQYNKEKEALLAGTSVTVSSDVALDVAKKQLAVEQSQLGITQAQLDLQNAKQAVDDAKSAIAPAQVDVQNAQDDLKTAQNNLDDAKNNSPEVKAPFDGFITGVTAVGGADVKKGAVAVTIADPTKFEAALLVSETDISKIKVGGTASVELQAIAGTSLSANVTHIAPTATIQSGVVNYKVTVEVGSQPVTQVQQQVSTNVTSGNAPSGIPFAPGGQAFGSANLTQAPGGQSARGGQGFVGGNLTQEQINQRLQQRQQASGGQGFGSANLTQEQIAQAQQRLQVLAGQTGGQTQTVATTSTSNVRLAQGMTVTVTIPVDSRTNVILVPNRAISRSGGQTVVKVSKAGVVESRSITTGLSNGTYTEVISGLSEGEQVVITQTTTTTQQGGQGGIGIPGIGGLGR